MSDDTSIVASFSKNSRELVCVGVNTWRRKEYIFIRVFAQAIGEEHLVPTRAGISLHLSQYPELLDGARLLGDVMGSDKVVARIRKSQNKEVRIGFTLYRDAPLIYLRTFVLSADQPEGIPTKQGISVRVEQYPYLLEAIEELGNAIKGIE